jgi:hypothetical protein
MEARKKERLGAGIPSNPSLPASSRHPNLPSAELLQLIHIRANAFPQISSSRNPSIKVNLLS